MSDLRSLDELRAEIDRLDDLVQDTLMRRAEVVAEVALAKRGASDAMGTALRPDREAAMARRLAERHRGDFPLHSLQRIWREIVGALTQVQVPFAVHLGARDSELLDAARFAFGNAAEMVAHDGAMAALAAAGERESDVAALPVAGAARPLDGSTWWHALPERAGVLMRTGPALVVGPRMDLAWDVGLAIAREAPTGADVLARAPDGTCLVAGDVAALDPALVIRPIGGYQDGPWVHYTS